MFGQLFGRGNSRAEGQRLFEEGMKAAVEFRSGAAIELYTQSIAASPNPAPYINRANLLMKRIRHRDARDDLEAARHLDARQGREFKTQIEPELNWAQAISFNWDNGLRKKLIRDLRDSDIKTVADRIIDVSFGVSGLGWGVNSMPYDLLEYHLFNDLDDIAKFDDLAKYPEADELLTLYDEKFIEVKVGSCPDSAGYRDAQAKLHSFLCIYDLEDMIQLRRHMIYHIHKNLLVRDFGAFYGSLSSDCSGIIREAEEFASL